MNVTILNVTVATKPTKTGKSYQEADVAYKNNTFQGKVEGKKLMSFGAQAESFKVVSAIAPGTTPTFEVEVVKNPAGYNDWVAMTPAGAGAGSPPAAPQKAPMGSATATPRSTQETPEERANRQVLIVRQSSISSAIAALSVGSKKVESTDVLSLAKKFEDFVMGKPSAGASGFEDFPDVPDEFAVQQPEVD